MADICDVTKSETKFFCSKIHNIVNYSSSSVSSYLAVSISTVVGQIQCGYNRYFLSFI